MRCARVAFPLVVTGIAVLTTAGVAGAHARLEASDPTSGAELSESPPQVLLDFDEPVELGLGGVTLTMADSSPIEIGAATQPEGKPDVVTASLPTLGDGVYVVSYRVVSADGHPVSGDIVFRIGSAGGTSIVESGQEANTVVGIAYGVVRLVAYLSLAVGLGLACFVLIVWRGGWPRLRWTIAVAGWTLAAATWAQLLLAGPYLAGTGLGDAFEPALWQQVAETTAGKWWIARFAALVALAVLWYLSTLRSHARWRWPIRIAAVVGAAVVVASFVGDGHAAAGRYLAIGAVSDRYPPRRDVDLARRSRRAGLGRLRR